jgi:hypothetical protein
MDENVFQPGPGSLNSPAIIREPWETSQGNDWQGNKGLWGWPVIPGGAVPSLGRSDVESKLQANETRPRLKSPI